MQLLRINRHAIILMDSDRTAADDPINATKQRIIREIEPEGMAWVTAGRTIENYLPADPVRLLHGGAQPNVDQFGDFAEYLEGIKAGEGDRFKRKKVDFAQQVLRNVRTEHLLNLDLAEQCEMACALIRQWNGVRPPSPEAAPVRREAINA